MATLMTLPAPTPSRATESLYAVEETLAALIETVELVPAEQRDEFLAEFKSALVNAVSKRDDVGRFMAHVEAQIAFSKSEIDRLRERKQNYERALAWMEQYVQHVIESLGKDKTGAYRKLEGKTVTFALRRCPPSVDITDGPRVPARFKTITITLPGKVWELLLDSIDLDVRQEILEGVRYDDVSFDKRAIKAEIAAKREVPGTDLLINKYSLRVE